MRLPLLLVTLWLLFPIAYAAETPTPKVQFKGDASTYNPNFAGWKTGGQGLATGGRYNPNEYEAALQLGLAQKYRCGYGAGRTCCAVVQTQEGRSAIVKINDNGPLVSGRVIDLNEKSMQYLSNGKYGRNSGVLKNVTVALLDGNNCKLGPVDERDREAWANKIFGAPTDQPPAGSYSYPSGQGQTIGQAYQSNQGGQYPQAMPSQQAQPVMQPGGAQPGQYFSPQQTGAPSPYSSGLSALPSISLTGEGGTSVADKLLSLLGVSTTPTFSGVEIGKSTGGSAISVETSGGKFVITSTNKPGITYTSGSTTVRVEKREGDTFGAGVNYSASSTNAADPLFNILLKFRDILSGILQSLREIVNTQ